MVLIGRVEVAQRLDFDTERQSVLLGLFCNDLVDDGAVGRIAVIDACTVACALVFALLVEAGGVDGLEVHFKQETQADYRWVVAQMHRLGITRLVGVDFLVGGVLSIAVGEAYLGKGNAFNQFQIFLCAPEAAGGQIDVPFTADRRKQLDNLLKPFRINLVKGPQLATVDVDHGNNSTFLNNRHHYFAATLAAAGYVSRKLLHVGHNHRATLLPRRAAHAFAVTYVHTGHRPLERTENQFTALYTVESCPPKAKAVVQHCRYIGHYRNGVVLASDKACYLFVYE